MDVMTVIGTKTSGLCSKLHILGNIVVLQTLDLLSNQNTWDICIKDEAHPLWFGNNCRGIPQLGVVMAYDIDPPQSPMNESQFIVL